MKHTNYTIPYAEYNKTCTQSIAFMHSRMDEEGLYFRMILGASIASITSVVDIVIW